MIASLLINPMLPTLRPANTVGEALDWMSENRLPQLVVADNEDYKGIAEEELLLEIPEPDQLLSEVLLQHSDTYATEDQHLYELIRISRQFGLRIIPILGEDRLFKGSISQEELLEQFAVSLGVQEKGAILVLQVNQRDYSLSEISRLIESAGAKIVSSQYAIHYDYHTQEESLLTLKLNRVNITSVLATLERFGYVIREAHANDPVDSIDQERLDLLLRYLAT